MDISLPPSLSNEATTIALVETLQKLLDQNQYKKVKEEIVSHHALNEAEAKKAADAKTLIKQHSDILEETKKISDKNELDKKDLEKRNVEFKQKCAEEGLKIAEEWAAVEKAAKDAKELHEKATSMIGSIEGRENELKKNQDQYTKDIMQLKSDREKLEEDSKNVEKFKNEVIAMDNQTKAKVEKLKQFNF